MQLDVVTLQRKRGLNARRPNVLVFRVVEQKRFFAEIQFLETDGVHVGGMCTCFVFVECLRLTLRLSVIMIGKEEEQ